MELLKAHAGTVVDHNGQPVDVATALQGKVQHCERPAISSDQHFPSYCQAAASPFKALVPHNAHVLQVMGTTHTLRQLFLRCGRLWISGSWAAMQPIVYFF